MRDDGVSSGIAESRESPSTIINCTLGPYQRSKELIKERNNDPK